MGFCGFWSIRMLLYFPLSVRLFPVFHKVDITHLVYDDLDQTNQTFSESLSPVSPPSSSSTSSHPSPHLHFQKLHSLQSSSSKISIWTDVLQLHHQTLMFFILNRPPFCFGGNRCVRGASGLSILPEIYHNLLNTNIQRNKH